MVVAAVDRRERVLADVPALAGGASWGLWPLPLADSGPAAPPPLLLPTSGIGRMGWMGSVTIFSCMIRFLFADGPFGLGRSVTAEEEESGRGNSALLAEEGGCEDDMATC
jgi:hypothetical protein